MYPDQLLRDSYGNPATPFTTLAIVETTSQLPFTKGTGIGYYTDVNKNVPPTNPLPTVKPEGNIHFALPSYADGFTQLHVPVPVTSIEFFPNTPKLHNTHAGTGPSAHNETKRSGSDGSYNNELNAGASPNPNGPAVAASIGKKFTDRQAIDGDSVPPPFLDLLPPSLAAASSNTGNIPTGQSAGHLSTPNSSQNSDERNKTDANQQQQPTQFPSNNFQHTSFASGGSFHQNTFSFAPLIPPTQAGTTFTFSSLQGNGKPTATLTPNQQDTVFNLFNVNQKPPHSDTPGSVTNQNIPAPSQDFLPPPFSPQAPIAGNEHPDESKPNVSVPAISFNAPANGFAPTTSKPTAPAATPEANTSESKPSFGASSGSFNAPTSGIAPTTSKPITFSKPIALPATAQAHSGTKYTGGFGGAPGILGDQKRPGYAVQPDGSIREPPTRSPPTTTRTTVPARHQPVPTVHQVHNQATPSHSPAQAPPHSPFFNIPIPPLLSSQGRPPFAAPVPPPLSNLKPASNPPALSGHLPSAPGHTQAVPSFSIPPVQRPPSSPAISVPASQR